jgi:uncharacterized SAM-binding protein YcdF (DUF218 family)
MTVIKQLVYLFFPMSLCALLFATGVGFLWLTKKQRMGKWVITVALCFFLSFGNQFVSHFLLSFLEYKYPALLSFEEITTLSPPIRYIVILGGEPRLRKALPITDQINRTVLSRFIEGMRLYKALPETKLVLSGGEHAAETMNEMALALAISQEDILLEAKSINTHEEALLLKELLMNQSFILVTSARHMPRSVALFRHAGLDPIPAPTGYLSTPSPQFHLGSFLPSSSSFERSHEAFYEYLALIKDYSLGRI